MRVGIDCMTLHGRYSGVEKTICALLRSLAQACRERGAEHEFLLYCGRDVPDLGPLPENFVWRPARFPAQRKLRRVFWQQFELPRLAARDGLAVLHGPAYVTPISSPVPTVATVHDLMVFLHPEMCAWHNRMHYRLVLPRSIAAARCIAVPSEATRKTLIELLGVPEERVRKVTFSIDPRFAPVSDEELLAETREVLDLPSRFVLFVGNLEPKKGILVLLEAFVQLKQRRDLPHSLLIAGKRGWLYRDILRRAQEPEMQRFVRLLGYVEDRLLPALYSLAEVFVLPSFYEGFGLPVLEAMACGTPVICSDAGALAEVAHGAARIVPMGDAEALAQALGEVLSDDALRAELRQRGLQRARQFPPEAIGREMLDIYEAVADER